MARSRRSTVQFDYSDESDGVNHTTDQSFPFYPIPDEAITQPHWIEGGEPGNVDRRSEQRPPPAHRRPRQPSSLRALQRLLRRRAVARRLGRLLRPERQRPASGRLDVGGRRRARDPARTRPLRRGLRTRRDRPRVPRDRSLDQRLRLPRIPPRRIDDRRAADGRAAATQGEQESVGFPAGDTEDLPRDAALRADRRRQRLGHVHQRHVRHTLEQRRPEPGVRRAECRATSRSSNCGWRRAGRTRPSSTGGPCRDAPHRPTAFRCLVFRFRLRLRRPSVLSAAAAVARAARDRSATTSRAPCRAAAPSRRCRVPSRA